MEEEEIGFERKSFKEMSVVPNKKDFVDVILSLREHQKPAVVVPKFKKSHRFLYVDKVRLAQKRILDKLTTVLNDFSLSYKSDLVRHGFDLFHVMHARGQLLFAVNVIFTTVGDYVRLMNKDDCASLDECKRLKVAAVGCMFSLAMRCIPSLDYFEKMRQYMANLGDDENAAAAAATTSTHGHVLAVEDCTVPHTLDVHMAAGFVDPETMSWLWELERKHGFMLQGDDHVVSNTWQQSQGAPAGSAISSMQALAI